jgi:hydroxyacylglutathione hydrolase
MSERVHPIVEQISTYFDSVAVELYFIKSERKIIVDAGTRQSPQRDILPRLKALDLTLSDLNMVLNTHGHFDHTAGNVFLKEVSGAQIGIHEDDASFLSDPANCFGRYLAPVVKAIESSVREQERAFLEMMGPRMAPDRQLSGEERIDCGGGVELKVLHLPGHTLGSVGYLWEEEGILFSGDSIVGLHVEGGKLPVILDLPAYKESLGRLKEVDIRFLLCGHHYRGVRSPAGSARQGKEIARYIEDSREFAERLDEAVTKAIPDVPEKSFMQVADLVISSLPREWGFLPMSGVQKPLYSAQAIFFRLRQLFCHNKTDDF